MTETLKVTGYVGATRSTVQHLLTAPETLPVPARVADDHVTLVAPGTPLDGAEVTTTPVGPETSSLTEVTLRLRRPFAGPERKDQFLTAARVIAATTERIHERLRRAA